jgi:hypothetical protein
MTSERPKYIFKKLPEKIYRNEGRQKKQEELEVTFSGPLKNESEVPGSPEWKAEVTDDLTGNVISTITFNRVPDGIRIGVAASEMKYAGNEIGFRLYENLASYAKSQGMRFMKSDCVVSGGAIAVWKKLQEKGYDVRVNPQAEEQYRDFIETYSEGKYFKKSLSVLPHSESVFELHITDDSRPE